MQSEKKKPKDAAAVILLKDDAVFLAQRNPLTPFLGGWHAFPGGKLDPGDHEITIKNSADEELAPYIVCAVRETFEETGILLARGGDKMTKGQRASLLDDLLSGRSSFAEILDHWGLWIDAADFIYTGFWTTPQFSPVRFKTRFFTAECPGKQQYAATAELVAGEFISPKDAVVRWEKGEILITPPVLISLQQLAKAAETCEMNARDFFSSSADLAACAAELRRESEVAGGEIDYIGLNSHITCFPLKTETLPPATHTNCFIVGEKEFIVIDAAAKDAGEQEKLWKYIASLIKKGGVCQSIITTHAHPDHFGGETVLQTRLRESFGMDAPLAAHRQTAEALRGKVEFQQIVEDGDSFRLKDKNGASFELTALHTPGHARGLLAFYDAEKGFLLSGDNVVSGSTVVIAPPDGNMGDYLQTLERLKNLLGLRFLCGSHGAALYDAAGKIESYIRHRIERENQILKAIDNGAASVEAIVSMIYGHIEKSLLPLARLSVTAHLEKLEKDLNRKLEIIR